MKVIERQANLEMWDGSKSEGFVLRIKCKVAPSLRARGVCSLRGHGSGLQHWGLRAPLVRERERGWLSVSATSPQLVTGSLRSRNLSCLTQLQCPKTPEQPTPIPEEVALEGAYIGCSIAVNGTCLTVTTFDAEAR